MTKEVTIIPFCKEHQNDIDSMMESIAMEFQEPIFTTQSKKIVEVFQSSNNRFWVAIINLKVVGTIGLTKLSNSNIALKSMFVNKPFRGQGISILLLENLISWATKNNYKQIYLGTMTQFLAG